MTVHSPIDVPADADWLQFRMEASLWRGRMIQHFATVEDAVTETLVHLGGGRAGRKLPHLAGQRRDTLRKALESTPNNQAKLILSALDQFELVAGRRAFLCHGREQVLTDHRRQWYLYLNIRAASGDADDQSSWLVSKKESETLLSLLNASTRRLVDRLTNFRNAVPATA